MAKYWSKHVFTAELPYEKDQVVTLFLIERFQRVNVFIMSLGQMSDIPPSRLFSYQLGRLTSEKKFIKNNLNSSGFMLYFIRIPRALFSVTFDLLRALKSINFTCDIFFAQHFLPAFIAVVLRKLGIFKCYKIVFWMFDFFPTPSEFPRSLYYRGMNVVQGLLRKYVDEIWYTTPRLIDADIKRFGPLQKTVIKRLTEGCFFRRIKTEKPPAIPPLRLAFLGSLRRDTAIYESIDATYSCVKSGMNVELHVIGSGPEEKYVKQYVNEKNLSYAVRFYGFEDRGEEIAKILSKCHLGMALYPSLHNSPNRFLTSGKFRRYISQGLPVISSNVPYFAKYIRDYKAGVVLDNDPKAVLNTLQTIYHRSSLLKILRKGVDKLYNTYKADEILEKTFCDML